MAVQIKVEPVFPSDANFLAKKGEFLLRSLESVVEGDISKQLELAMQRRVSNWRNAPDFKSDFNSLPTRLSLLVTPAGRNKKYWVMVSAGVPAHIITPKKKKFLFIRGGVGGYRAKTRPGNFYGGPGSYGGNSFYTRVVSHPGIQPRNFEQNVV